VDVVIIGAGLLGCFSARALSAWKVKTVVLEAREDVCTGLSKANAGIVYSGYDTKPGTLKTRLCIQGCKDFAQLCGQLDVPFKVCASLMVSFGPRGEERLRRKFRQGMENGVEGLRLLSREEVLELEPLLSQEVTLGLLAPGTGTVDPWALGIAAFENAADNGVEFHFEEPVLFIERTAEGFLVRTNREEYAAKSVINCAGIAADKVREFTEEPRMSLVPTGADFLVLDAKQSETPTRIIFQETEEGKGITLVPTVDGTLLLGPTEREEETGSAVTKKGLVRISDLGSQLMPSLPLEKQIRSFAGVRPNPYYVRKEGETWEREETSVSGFSVLEEKGLISLIGIKTPGLTCAAGLGEYAAEKVLAHLGGREKYPGFTPVRKGVEPVRKMPREKREALVREHPEFGEIVCRCREITKGEILEAIRRGAVTVDGVKRRTGAGMGPCQGSRCIQTVLEQLSREKGLPAAAVTKDGSGTEIVLGEGSGKI